MPLARCEESPVGELCHEGGSGSAGTPIRARAGSSVGGRPRGRIVGGVRGATGRADRGVPLAEQPQPDAGPVADAAVPPRRRRTLLLLVLAAVIVAADQLSKLAVVATIAPGEEVPVLGHVVTFTQLRNVGAAFSFAQGATILFTVIALAVAVVIVRTSRRLYSAAWAVALGLVLGGALGNLIDRILRSPGFLRGGVVDFVKVGWWPVFNVADSAIVCGGILGALLAVRGIEFDGSRHAGGAAAGTSSDSGPAEDGAARR
jgi:signal peptidase II